MRTMLKRFALLLCPALIAWQVAQADPTPVQAQKPSAQDGVEVEARGQIHEAFAAPAIARPSATPIVRKKPPEAINELPPDQKPEGDNVQWIPGYWMWDEDRTDFLWVSGTWRNIPPEKRWVPGYWDDEAGGFRWVSGYWVAETQTQINLQPEPPEPIEEAAPAFNEATQTYVPGIWMYHENQYRWRPGYAVNHYPGWIWTPASYHWTPGGYIFTDGYWDYDLNRRGLAFAPVYLSAGIYAQPNWYYRPNFVISTDFFLGSLFVNIGWNHYYFGDYYDNRYSRMGYSPWVNYRQHNRYHDHMYSYYRQQYRNDPRWERNIQNVYTARRDGSMQRPGRTLAQIERTGAATGQPGAQTAALVSIDKWKDDNIKLQRLPQGEDRKLADQFKNMSKERRTNETRSRTSLYPPERSTGKDDPTESRDRTKDTPPVKAPPAKKDAPPAKAGDAPGKFDTSTRPANRYELPKSNQTYRRPEGQKAPPERPKQPAPQQNPPSKGSGKPGKGDK